MTGNPLSAVIENLYWDAVSSLWITSEALLPGDYFLWHRQFGMFWRCFSTWMDTGPLDWDNSFFIVRTLIYLWDSSSYGRLGIYSANSLGLNVALLDIGQRVKEFYWERDGAVCMAEEIFRRACDCAKPINVDRVDQNLNRVSVYVPPREWSRDGSSSFEAARSVGVLDIRLIGLGSPETSL